MVNKIIETFELSDIETKTLDDFQSILFQMKEISTRKETQHTIENIYCSIENLISVKE
jgi:hypothetical protein